ncbi:O-methyltransferase [Desertihabitans aurantiacus]|uniref:O-methyltransferase n=1 Tax=Desertihabitans aurantiacus TaxID=2282477 RepID=UPI000DF76C7C|nr:cytidine deaminase [Desertihabitans aurantiacus]
MSTLPGVPSLVTKALRKSLAMGYLEATRTETGRLLATLAATRQGTIAECGTGCGVGAAWLRSGAPSATRVLTAELEGSLAHEVADMFAGDGIDVLHADWSALESAAPFSLLFLDASQALMSERDDVIALVEPGGMIVLDDFTPSISWPPRVHDRLDRVRSDWLADPRLTSAEVMVAPDAAVIIAVLRPGAPASA